MTAGDLVALARPGQWTKNGILFAGLIFSRHLFDPAFALRAAAAAAIFCLASSAIYAFNDIEDVARDRVHPKKRDRPLPSGRVPTGAAWMLCLVLAGVTLTAAALMGRQFLVALVVFYILNLAYSLFLKNVVVLDVMMIALSFVTRAVAGVMVLRPLEPGLEISPWLLVCTMFLALFLGFGKRRHELTLLDSDASGHRATLGEYSREFLDQLIAIVTGATLIAYAIYTVAPETVSKFHTVYLVTTVPIVAYGIFRYLFLIQRRGKGGNPSRILYRDFPLAAAILAWLVAVSVVLYVGGH